MSDGSPQRPAAAHGGRLAAEALDREVLALVWLLAEAGVPLTVVSPRPDEARELRNTIVGLLPAERRAADVTLAGGVVAAGSLEETLRILGSSTNEELPDEARDLGVVLIVRAAHVVAAHYVRPVERDAAGHLQRRPPATLSAWNDRTGRHDHFYWAITDELATRAGMARDEFEDRHAERVAQLAVTSTGYSSTAHRH